MQTENRFFDDLARVATGALGAFTGMRAEVEARLRDQMERLLSRMDLVTREEFAAVQAMAAKARGEQERLEQRLLAIEARLQALEAAAGERAVAEAAAAEKPAAEKPKRRGGERPAAADESETG
ncbi:MAG TPA: accessory factor UbiK family protein [Stellaceae bacterium]|nr:accessory factor UbiK family protein [Stellaceae bacterium]